MPDKHWRLVSDEEALVKICKGGKRGWTEASDEARQRECGVVWK